MTNQAAVIPQNKESRVRMIAKYQGVLKPHDTLHTSVHHTQPDPATGVTRWLRVHRLHYAAGEVKVQNLTLVAAVLCGFPYHDRSGSIVLAARGQDMGQHIVAELSKVLNIQLKQVWL